MDHFGNTNPSPSRPYAVWLWLLLGLFALRVTAQPAALVMTNAALPPFDAWHSGMLPYKVLLGSQLLILAALGRTAWRFSFGNVVPRRGVGIVALLFGVLYFVVMTLRLILGLTVLGHNHWFARPLPTMFHLVLASFALLFGHFHYICATDQLADRDTGSINAGVPS